MTDINKDDSLILTIRDIHPEDGYAWAKDQLKGKQFDAFLTTTSVGHPGWYMVAGTFIEDIGIPEIDGATKEQPIIISMSKYTV